jgi:hypothetical protein
MAGLRAGRGLTVSTSAACLCIEGLHCSPASPRLLEARGEQRETRQEHVAESIPRAGRITMQVVEELDVWTFAGRGHGAHESSARASERGAWRLVGAATGRGNEPAP